MTDEVTKAKAARWDRQMAEAVVEAVRMHVADPAERARVLDEMARIFSSAAGDAAIEAMSGVEVTR